MDRPQVIRLRVPAPMKGSDLSGFGDGAVDFLNAPTPMTASAAIAPTPAPATFNMVEYAAAQPAAATAPASTDWSSIFNTSAKAINALTPLAATAGTLYLQNKQAKSASSAAAAAASLAKKAQAAAALAAKNAAAAKAKKKTPIWVMPAIIGGVAVVGLAVFFILRKKSSTP